jgi:hypothetical protein
MLARLAAPVLLASVLGACSSIPDWVDPTGWLGGDNEASSDQGGAASGSQAPDSGQTPDLASIPPKPAAPSTPDEQQQVANSLAADRTQAQYSAEALQGGTEPVAPPPPAESSPPPEASAPPSTPPAQAAATDNASSSDNSPAQTAGSSAPPAAAPDSSGTQMASTESPNTSAPAAAPMRATTSNAQPATDIQTGFAPSHAPALDPSVAQYVPQRILTRYQQTAAAAAVPGMTGMSSATPNAVRHRKAKVGPTESASDTSAPPAQ